MTHHLIINLWILHKLYSSTKALRTRVFPYSICQCILIFHFFFTQFRTEALLLVPLVKFLDWNLLWRGLPLFSASAGKVNSFDLWRFCVQFFKLKITAWAQSFLHPCLQMNSFRFDSLRFFCFKFLCEICSTRIYFYRDLCATIDIEVNKLKAVLCQKPKNWIETRAHNCNPITFQIELKCSQGEIRFGFISLKFILE